MESSNKIVSIDYLEDKISKLSIKQEKVGYVFDERMLLHKTFKDKHVERPERAMSIYLNLVNKGLTDKLIAIDSCEISSEDLLRVHSKELIDNIKTTQLNSDLTERSKKEHKYTFNTDCYDNFATYESALLSSGSLLNCCKAVIEKKVKKAFAIIRPPGHHASSNKCAGFCFFNNVAVSAKYLTEVCKLKVAIVDWDVHHGDGTEEIFLKDNNPLFISIHKFNKGSFYPPKSGSTDSIGVDQGKGFNLNITWDTITDTDKSSIGDAEYFYTFNHIVIPVLKEYKPDFILVSSGFDAAENDPLGGLSLSPIGYSYMTKQLMNISENIVVALEGGYNLDSLARCSEAVIRTLQGDNTPFKGLLLNKNIENLNLQLNDLNENLFTASNYALKQLKATQTKFIEFWPTLKNYPIKITENNEKIHRKNEIPDQLLNEAFVSKYLFNEESDISHDYIRLRLNNQNPILTSLNDEEKINSFKNTLINSKTIINDYGFRIEAIRNAYEKTTNTKAGEKLNWFKTDRMFDIVKDCKKSSFIHYVSLFLEKAKIKKEDVLDSLKELIQDLKTTNFCFNNVDLYIMTSKKEGPTLNVTTRSKAGIVNKPILKLSGLKKKYCLEKENLNLFTSLNKFLSLLEDNLS